MLVSLIGIERILERMAFGKGYRGRTCSRNTLKELIAVLHSHLALKERADKLSDCGFLSCNYSEVPACAVDRTLENCKRDILSY